MTGKLVLALKFIDSEDRNDIFAPKKGLHTKQIYQNGLLFSFINKKHFKIFSD